MQSQVKKLAEFLKVVPGKPQVDSGDLETFEHCGHTIKDSEKQRKEALSICNQFLNGIVSSLHERFSSNKDAVVMTCLNNFLNPMAKLQSDSSSDIEQVAEYLGSVGFMGHREELVRFSKYVVNMLGSGSKLVSTVRDVCNLAINNSDTFPGHIRISKEVSTGTCFYS